MEVLASYNIKGGVGKTATAVNLAYLAAQEGFRTLIWDLDPQGAASFYFRIKPKIKGGTRSLVKRKSELGDAIKATDFEGLDIIPADFSMRNFDLACYDTNKPVKQLSRLLRPISPDYDLMFLDCAPSISLTSENIFQAADFLLIPMIPTTLSVRTYEQIINYFEKHRTKNLKLLPFFSMYDNTRRMHRTVATTLPKDYKEILQTTIPYAKKVELMGLKRAPVGDFAPDSAPATAYRNLWNEIRLAILRRPLF